MTLNAKFAFLIAVSLLCMPAVRAQQSNPTNTASATGGLNAVPRLVRFSGTVRDAAGKPNHGAQDVTFSLYATESGGEALWFEAQTVEVDALGRYTVLLGALHPDGLPMALFTSGEARWLGVSVGKLPEQARVLLVAVPYALKASDADTLGGKPAAAYALQGQVGSSVVAVGGAQKSDAAHAAALASTTESQPSAVVSAGQTHFIDTTSDYVVRVTQNGTGRGLYGLSQSGEAVYGQILGLSGTTYGVRGITPSTTGAGVYGANTATTGAAYGVRGNSSSTGGAGVAGFNTAATGSAFGVIGQTSSSGGVGLFGRALHASGVTFGLQGIADSTSGTGINAQATAVSGTTTGLFAGVNSPAGTAIVANHVAGGKIFSGRNNGVESFNVGADGNILTIGTVTAAPASGSSTVITGQGVSGVGVKGTSTDSYGVQAISTNFYGLQAIGSVGLIATGTTGYGIEGFSANGNAIYGSSDASSGAGVYGYNTNSFGVGTVGNGWVGVSGLSNSPTGIAGRFTNLDASGKLIAALAGSGSPIEVFTVWGSGNVGLGTANPLAKLSLHSNGGNTIRMTNDNVNNTNSGTIDFLEGTGTFGTDAAGMRLIYNGVANQLQLLGSGGAAASTLVTIDRSAGGELEINGGVRLNTLSAKPPCNTTFRGTFWVTQGTAGVKDSVQVCAKDASDAYAWRTIY